MAASIVHNLFCRETSAKPLQRLANPFGSRIPDRLSMPMESILPPVALQNGHIFLGFTNCGRFLLSYTIREELENAYNRNEMAFFYKLHIWLFVAYKQSKRVASILLFSNTGVADNNLLIDISQWRNDDSRIVILGRNYSPEVGGARSLFYVTMTTLPSTSGCSDCSRQHVSADFDDSFHVHGLQDRGNCLRHCITTHLVYERVPPFPKFDFEIQLRLRNSIVLNTGNALHIFSYNVTRPQQDSAFIPELLFPPKHHEPKRSKKRLLRCDFSFKNSNSLSKILSNCSPREASRILTKTAEDCDTEYEAVAEQEGILASIPLSMSFDFQIEKTKFSRRLSQSSLDSEVSGFSSLSSRSTNLSQATATDDFEFEAEPPKSPPKKLVANSNLRKPTLLGNCRNVPSSSASMPPPGRRKFFKTGQQATTRKKSVVNKGATSASKSIEKTYDIFEVGAEEVLLERSLSSYRKRRNADKQYEFSDPDISTENFVPLKMSRSCSRRRFGGGGSILNSLMFGTGSKSPRSAENASPTDFAGFESYPKSPRGLVIHSPAMSPSYAEHGRSGPTTFGGSDILRPLTNYNNLNKSPNHPLFSPPLTREFCDADYSNSKFCRASPEIFAEEETCGESVGKESRNSQSLSPNFSTYANCIAKILRCYVDKDDDNLSVKTDTDDEYNQTVPFPVALNLDVHGTAYRNLQLINNSKVNCSATPVVEVLQRTLEVEILCNEVAGMICLSADKNFISCFDYDVAILDVCPEIGNITAVAVVLIYASNLQKDVKYEHVHNPGQELRQKYEAIFSFQWLPVHETCKILHVGHMREIDTTPENWHPTKDILQRLKEVGLPRESLFQKQRVLSNELAVFEWQSLEELVDSSGLIRLHSGGGSSTLNSRSNSLIAFSALSTLDIDMADDDDEDLSDYY